MRHLQLSSFLEHHHGCDVFGKVGRHRRRVASVERQKPLPKQSGERGGGFKQGMRRQHGRGRNVQSAVDGSDGGESAGGESAGGGHGSGTGGGGTGGGIGGGIGGGVCPRCQDFQGCTKGRSDDSVDGERVFGRSLLFAKQGERRAGGVKDGRHHGFGHGCRGNKNKEGVSSGRLLQHQHSNTTAIPQQYTYQ